MRIGPFGIWELVILVVVVLLVFGPKYLPQLAKGAGRSVRLFRKEVRDLKADLDLTSTEPSRPPAATGTAQPGATPTRDGGGAP